MCCYLNLVFFNYLFEILILKYGKILVIRFIKRETYMNSVIITDRLNNEQKEQVCRLIYQGFYKKLSNYWIFEKNIDKGSEVLQGCINYENGIYAIEDNKVVGFIGVQYRKKKFREFNSKTLKPYYGTFGSMWRGVFNKLENKTESLKDNEMYIDLIVVDSNHRVKVISSLLIDRITKFYIQNDFYKILIDVVDTNESAIKLYEKLGYNHLHFY